MNVLIAEDEKSMQKILVAYFEKEGFKVFTADDGQEALEVFYLNKIDLVILDWMMPNIDGIDVCKEIKSNSSVKVLMLTAKSQNEDEIKALNCGADEYIKKPFDPRILIIRAKKLIDVNEVISIKDLNIDLKRNKVYKNDIEVSLTKTELELLKYFISNKGIILSRNRLIDSVWGIDYDGDLKTLNTHIRRLRAKIGDDIIKTHKGIGYSLEGINDQTK